MDVKKIKNVKVLNHPLLSHKISILRNKKTNTTEFRRIVQEVAILEGYEAFHNVKTKMVKITTPIATTVQPMIDGSKLCFVPILRAGLGMVDGLINLIPSAKIGHIGLYRDPKTKLPVEYFCKLPKNIKKMDVYLIDPMLATGGSAIDAINSIKKRGVKNISFICMVACPEGVNAVHKAHPDVPIYIGALDEKLNDNKYIIPGLGDAGDRIYGTED